MPPTRYALESFRRASLLRHTTLLPKSSFRNKERLCVASCKRIRIPKSDRFLLVESGILAPVVQKLDIAIHRINCYPVDKYYEIQLRYPLERYPLFEQLERGLWNTAREI